MFVMLFGTVIFVNPMQPAKAFYPMLVTESGIIMFVRPVQPENALDPMLVTESRIVMPVRPVQPWNTESPILVTIDSISTVCGSFIQDNPLYNPASVIVCRVTSPDKSYSFEVPSTNVIFVTDFLVPVTILVSGRAFDNISRASFVVLPSTTMLVRLSHM